MADPITLASLANVQFAVELLIVTIVAMVAWVKTPPRTWWKNIQEFFEEFVSTLVLAFVVALGISAGGVDVLSLAGILSMLGTVYLGWGGISIFLQRYQIPGSSPGPPAP